MGEPSILGLSSCFAPRAEAHAAAGQDGIYLWFNGPSRERVARKNHGKGGSLESSVAPFWDQGTARIHLREGCSEAPGGPPAGLTQRQRSRLGTGASGSSGREVAVKTRSGDAVTATDEDPSKGSLETGNEEDGRRRIGRPFPKEDGAADR